MLINNPVIEESIHEEQKPNKTFMETIKENLNISNYYLKPKFRKLLASVITKNITNILNYLDLLDLCQVRAVDKLLLISVNDYYQVRLKMEIELITKFQEENNDKTELYMKNIDSQIPISNNNWLDFNLTSVTNKILSLDKETLVNIRAIKSLGKFSDLIYAPFCILMGENKNSNNKLRGYSWKYIAGKILIDPFLKIRISNLDLENIPDTEILEAFVFLNQPELEYKLVNNFSKDLGKLIKWCQGIISYHILIHPYTYRNEKSQITPESDVCEFAEKMNYLINRFYKFKRFLANIKIAKIPIADYVFNLQHSRPLNNDNNINYFDYLSTQQLGFILTYLPYNESYKLTKINRLFRYSFIESIESNLRELFREIYLFKFNSYEKLYKTEILYENNLFSKFFLMLDDILNSKCDNYGNPFIPFLTKDHLNDIKNIKKITPIVHNIAKICSLILDIKPKRISNSNGQIIIDYLENIKILIIKGDFLKKIRICNKLYFDKNKLLEIQREIAPFYSPEKLIEIKKINYGLYQLLIWELGVYEYIKNFNPLDFIDDFEKAEIFDENEIDLINYFIEIMNYCKYNLKIKYKYSNLFVPSFGFQESIEILKQELIEREIYNENLFNSININYEKIAHIYFESKDLIQINSKPYLYERIIVEIISVNCTINNNNQMIKLEEKINQIEPKNNNDNKLGIIQEEKMGMEISNKQSLRALQPNNNRKLFESNKYLRKGNSKYKYDNNQNYILNFNSIPNEIIIISILFYLDIGSLHLFSLINKKCCICLKTHMFIRLYFLGKERKLIQEQNKNLITSIETKKYNFCKEYDIIPPNIKNANLLVNKLTRNDLNKLKIFYKKYNKNYEILIKPFVYLMGKKEKIIYKSDGLKYVSFFEPAKEIIFDKNFIKKISEFELETILPEVYLKVNRIISQSEFKEENMKKYSIQLQNLINWIKGVIEFHKVIRKYCLNEFDIEILEENEIKFCNEMDTIDLLYYKLLRYAAKYCKKYEKFSRKLMEEMGISNE